MLCTKIFPPSWYVFPNRRIISYGGDRNSFLYGNFYFGVTEFMVLSSIAAVGGASLMALNRIYKNLSSS